MPVPSQGHYGFQFSGNFVITLIHDLSVLYNNTAHPDINEDFHFTDMWKT